MRMAASVDLCRRPGFGLERITIPTADASVVLLLAATLYGIFGFGGLGAFLARLGSFD